MHLFYLYLSIQNKNAELKKHTYYFLRVSFSNHLLLFGF